MWEALLSISIFKIQFVCLFVHLWHNNYGTERHQTLRDYEVELQKCPPRVEIPRFAVLDAIFFNFRVSFAADDHCSHDFRLTDGLIAVVERSIKLGRHYSSYPPLLTAQILRNSLGQTRCRATRRSKSPPKAGALLV